MKPIPGTEGCSDGACVFGHPGGMHTNGGCQCMKEIRSPQIRMRLQMNMNIIRKHINSLEDEAKFWRYKHDALLQQGSKAIIAAGRKVAGAMKAECDARKEVDRLKDLLDKPWKDFPRGTDAQATVTKVTADAPSDRPQEPVCSCLEYWSSHHPECLWIAA